MEDTVRSPSAFSQPHGLCLPRHPLALGEDRSLPATVDPKPKAVMNGETLSPSPAHTLHPLPRQEVSLGN